MKLYTPASYASMVAFITASGLSLGVSENAQKFITNGKVKTDKSITTGSIGTTWFVFNIVGLIFGVVHLGLIGYRQNKDPKFLRDKFNMIVLFAVLLAVVVACLGLNYNVNFNEEATIKNGKLRGTMGTAYFALNITTLVAAGSAFLYTSNQMLEGRLSKLKSRRGSSK